MFGRSYAKMIFIFILHILGLGYKEKLGRYRALVFVFLFFMFILNMLRPKVIYALDDCGGYPSWDPNIKRFIFSCSQAPNCPKVTIDYMPHSDNGALSLHYKINVDDNTYYYKFDFKESPGFVNFDTTHETGNFVLEGNFNRSVGIIEPLFKGSHQFSVLRGKEPGINDQYSLYCGPFQYTIKEQIIPPTATPTPPVYTVFNCKYNYSSTNTDPNYITPKDNIIVDGVFTPYNSGLVLPSITSIEAYTKKTGEVESPGQSLGIEKNTSSEIIFSGSIGQRGLGSYNLSLGFNNYRYLNYKCPDKTFWVTETGEPPTPTPTPNPNTCGKEPCLSRCQTDPICKKAGCECPGPTNNPSLNLKPLCDQIGQPDPQSDCHKCVDPPDEDDPNKGGQGGIWTAIGCIPMDQVAVVNKYILGAAGLGIAGGIAFLYFLFGAFKVLTSMGNAEAINEGKEIMVSSISGLLLIIFSVLILKIAGVDLLRIPGFGPTSESSTTIQPSLTPTP